MAIFADPIRSNEASPQLPDLPHSRLEAEILSKVFDFKPQIFTGKQAQATQFLSSLAESSHVVHYSGHGSFDLLLPEISGLWLAPTDADDSGYFHFTRLREISSNTRLIMLNGCGTGASRVYDAAGTGTMGFAREFHAAGVTSVLSTMWAASDSAAAALAEAFYENLREDMPRTTALREAQVKLLRSPHYRHPFYWAAYRMDSAEFKNAAEALPR